ncbi:molybdopterin molybdotransferase MoeA [Shewanella sedimentimangrovi]|uniref:Molybdopterin molybdenumtransferase n=1 Tax=Shewanella sedimentimangrovi TaxID=2814293 RepID=A0ABX7R3J6_9GAMM|nr:molybdopterin molybdotransferase MoeA [Shewanella sedimentimangrovi]QSX37400.1 molybdopterin molybdotransferase MoeA [Shewanella sedimentimangrovi]
MPMTLDPCAKPGLIHPDEAIPLLLSQVSAIDDSEMVRLAEALDRVLAEDLASGLDLPPFDNSAMDGYAFRFDELNGQESGSFKLAGQAFAGHPFTGELPPGHCVRIMTGAPVPAACDTVQMQEQTQVQGDAIIIQAPKGKGANVRRRGEELKAGTRVLTAGTRIRAAELGVIATIGISQLRVVRRPIVAFFSTGDELRPVGSELAPGQIYDSNRYSILGLLQKAGVEWLDLGVIPDDPEALRQAFRTAAAKADMVLTSGGVSVGEADYTKQILEQEGQIHFWKLAIKPGKPFAFGRIGKALFCGLPGNPVSSMVTFHKLVWPMLLKLQGQAQSQPLILAAALSTALRKQPGRVEYQRGILSRNAEGALEVALTGSQGSGMLTSMSLANCFILLDQYQGDLQVGETVMVEPFHGALA